MKTAIRWTKNTWQLLIEAGESWLKDRALTLSAALAYYTVFSIAPLLLISLSIGGIFFGEEASRREIFGSIAGLIGPKGAEAVESMVYASAVESGSILASVLGITLLVIGATTVFGQLQDSLNQIWKVESQPGRPAWALVRQRLLSFALILVVAFLLFVSLIASAALTAVEKFASEHLPGGAFIWSVSNTLVSFGLTVSLFAALFKILPDVRLRWREVAPGAAITAALFTWGKSLIGLYLGSSAVTSIYGAAGAAVIILLWSYYSTVILLFGAELTRTRRLRSSRPLELKEGIRWMETFEPPASRS